MIKKGEIFDVYERTKGSADWKKISRETVTSVRRCGHSSGGTDYYVYFDHHFKILVSDWNWELIWSTWDGSIEYKAVKVETV